MRRVTTACAVVGAALALSAMSAQAQATRTWVSGVGSDANPCSRTAPCLTFAGAISKTAAGGTINCLDPGGFGAVTINKSITIECLHNDGGPLATGGSSGVIVNAGVNDVVRLIGFAITGAGTGAHGIRVLAARAVHIHNVKIDSFTLNGIDISTPTGFAVEVYVDNTVIERTTNGINIQAAGTGTVHATITNNRIQNNSTGVRVTANIGTGTLRVAVRDNVVTGNTSNGVLSTATTGLAITFVERNLIFGNGIGVHSDGAMTFMAISNNTITLQTGRGLWSTSGGSLVTYSDNRINFNSGGDGAATGANLTPK